MTIFSLILCGLVLGTESSAQGTYTVNAVNVYAGGCEDVQLFCNGSGFLACFKVEAGKQLPPIGASYSFNTSTKLIEPSSSSYYSVLPPAYNGSGGQDYPCCTSIGPATNTGSITSSVTVAVGQSFSVNNTATPYQGSYLEYQFYDVTNSSNPILIQNWSYSPNLNSYSYNSPGVYYIGRVARAACQPHSTSYLCNSAQITVGNPCNLSASASSNPSSITSGSSSTLSASAFGGSGNYTYSWSHGLGSGASKTVTPTSTTTYTVTITDNTNTSCTRTATTTVNVTTPSCLPLTNGGSINATPNSVTLGYSVNINNLAFSSGGFGGTIQYLYEYSLNGGGYVAITGWTTSWATPFLPPSVGTYTIRRRARRSICTNEVYAYTNITVTPSCNLSGSASSSPSSITTGSSATLSASASGGSGNYSYTWNYGLGSGAIKTVSPTSTTTYTVTIRDNNNTTCLITRSVTVSVTACSNFTNGGSILGDESNCGSYDPTTITSVSSPSGGSGSTEYQWQYQSGGSWYNVSGATSTTYDPPPTSITMYYRRGAKRSGCSTYVYSNTVTKTVNPTPIANAGIDQTITQGSNATLTATATGGAGSYTYAWNNGLGNGATKTVAPTTTTTYIVTVTDANGCTNTDNVTINVISCNLTADAGANSAICTGGNQTLTATASNGTAPYTFSWNNGLGNGATKTVSPATTTTYTVTVTDANNCTATDQVTISISPFPTATISKTDAICNANTGTITFTFPDEPTQTSIAFSYDGGATYQTAVSDNQGSVTYNGLAAGTYNLYAQWGNSSCPTSLGNITIANNNDPTFCNPDFKFQKSVEKNIVRMEETIFYTFTFVNNSGIVLNNVQFSDNLSNNALFFSDPVQMTNGLQVVGTTLNTSSANFTLNNIPIGTSSFKLAVDIPSGLTQGNSYCNQAQISNLTASHPNLPDTIVSDNPNTSTPDDATCVTLKIYENCCNGIDDDGDGLCDTDDTDCQ